MCRLCFGRSHAVSEHQQAGAHLDEVTGTIVSPLPASRNPLPCWESPYDQSGPVAGDVCRRAGSRGQPHCLRAGVPQNLGRVSLTLHVTVWASVSPCSSTRLFHVHIQS